ncbi:hypothetical protein ACEPAI_9485 [Sanghuangporus weigelae]
MCVGFWSLDHTDYALILCSDPDEYLSRPTSTAHFHCFGPELDLDVNSGCDLKVIQTNISDAEGTLYKESMGLLVFSFLVPVAPNANHFVDLLEKERSTDYAGFNLLLLTPMSGGESGACLLAYGASLIANSGSHGTIPNGVDSPDGRTFGEEGRSQLDRGPHMQTMQTSGSCLRISLLSTYSGFSRKGQSRRFKSLFTLLHGRWQCEPPPIDPSSATRLDPDTSIAPAQRHFFKCRAGWRRNDRVMLNERDVRKVSGEGDGCPW